MFLRAQSFDSSKTASDYNSRLIQNGAYDNSIGDTGPFGSNYLYTNGYSFANWMQGFKPIPGGIGGFLGLRFRISNGPSYFAVTDPAGAGHLGVAVTTQGQVSVSRLSDHTNAGSVANTLFAGPIGQVRPSGWSFIELGWVIGAGVDGSVTARLNNETFFTVSGIATQGANSTSLATAAYIIAGNTNVQDIYVADSTGPAPRNTFFGDVRVVQTVITGAGSSSDFAPTGAVTNWQAAAQSAPTPATIYNSSTTVGATDLYTAAALPADLGVIFGVQVDATMYKADAGARTATSVIKSGAVVAKGDSHALEVAPITYSDVFNVDPATGVGFTAAGVNALQFGPTIVS